MTKSELEKIILGFAKFKILVIGDVMLDSYIWGDVDRISPEAPVPVVLQEKITSVLGGAGNVASNLAALGVNTVLIGLVGSDSEADLVRKQARRKNIKLQLVVDRSRPTTSKTRVVARGSQLIRVDREKSVGISPPIERKLIQAIKSIGSCDLVVISDYAKGVVTPRVVRTLKERFGAKSIIADIRPKNSKLYSNILAITPNVKEAEKLCGIYADTPAKTKVVLRELSRKFKTSIVLTMGERGMAIYDQPKKVSALLPTRALSVFNVTGAGDTVIAVLALGLLSKLNLKSAAELANLAAGIVVAEEGTSTVSPSSLLSHLAT